MRNDKEVTIYQSNGKVLATIEFDYKTGRMQIEEGKTIYPPYPCNEKFYKIMVNLFDGIYGVRSDTGH